MDILNQLNNLPKLFDVNQVSKNAYSYNFGCDIQNLIKFQDVLKKVNDFLSAHNDLGCVNLEYDNKFTLAYAIYKWLESVPPLVRFINDTPAVSNQIVIDPKIKYFCGKYFENNYLDYFTEFTEYVLDNQTLVVLNILQGKPSNLTISMELKFQYGGDQDKPITIQSVSNVGFKRLQHLRNWVSNEWDNIPKERKHLATWRNSLKPNGAISVHSNNPPITNDALKEGCNTVGCIIGWYTTDPDVNQDGLIYDVKKQSIKLKNQPDLGPMAALKQYFGLSKNEVEKLFYPNNYPNVRPTAAEILEKLDAVLQSKIQSQ